MPTEQKISVKAMCVFKKEGKALVSRGFDKVKNKRFYRLLGGSVNFFEKSEDGVRREIREELNSEIKNLKFITVSENVFTYEGNQGHEIVFLYSGDLSRVELYGQSIIHIVEETYEFDAEWIPIKDILSGSVPLYPALDYTKLLQ